MAILQAQRQDEVPSDHNRRYMDTNVKVMTDSGLVVATTRIWTRQPWLGFHGFVSVLVVGAGGEVLDYTSPHSFGVDGFRIPFKSSDRTAQWFDAVETGAAQRASGLEITHLHCPKPQLQQILEEAKQTAKNAAEIAAIVRTFAG